MNASEILIDSQNFSSYSIKAQDGEIGHIEDFYFDDNHYYLRYFVVNTKSFLNRNLVLISPLSLYKINPDKKTLEVFITKQELQDSPPIDSKLTISEQYDKAYHDYFNWPYYWSLHGSAWGMSTGPYGVPWAYYENMNVRPRSVDRKRDLLKKAERNNLRSSSEVCSYSIKGSDDKFGHIQGYIINRESLKIEFFIIDTIKYLPSKLILLRPEWIESISWKKKIVSFPFSKDFIKAAPKYEKNEFSESFIESLDRYFRSKLIDSSKAKFTNFLNSKTHLLEIQSESKSKKTPATKDKVVADIPSGLFILTTLNPETQEAEGFLASWVQQASFEPLMISVCVKDGRSGLESLLERNQFCLNVVGEDNLDYIEEFVDNPGQEGKAKQIQTPHRILNGKGVVLSNARSAMVCKPTEISHPGDHYLITAEVKEGILLNESSRPKVYLRTDARTY